MMMAEAKNSTSNLEDLKKARTQLRRAFTIACNQFAKIEESKEVESKEIHTIYNKIVDKSTRLFDLDSQINLLDNISEEEFDLTESYREKFIEIKVIYDSYVEKEFVAKSCDLQSQVSANLKLPKIILKEYDVVPKTWVAFWGQFSRIHNDDSLKEEDKFQYLLASVKANTKARDIVESYPPSKENYLKVIEHLKSRFGRTDLLIEVYIRDLLALVLNRQNVRLAELYDKLGSNLRSLETLGVTTKNYAAMLYPVVESCLPVEVLKAWDRYRLNAKIGEEAMINITKEKLLEALMAFLSHEVEGEEHRILAENGFGRQKCKREINKSFQTDEPTAAALISSFSEKSFGRADCVFCHKPHSSQYCRKASSMSLEERKNAIKQAKCCLLCIKKGHYFQDCRSKVRCMLCNKRHYVILCPQFGRESVNFPTREHENEEEKPATLLSSQSSNREVYLKTVMLRLRNNGKEVCVRSLLDDGSHRSYIETSLVEELNLQSSGTEILSQSLFGGGTTPAAKHGIYKLNIEGLDKKYSIPVTFLDQAKICAALPRIQDEELISELSSRGIVLSDIGRNAPPIRVLLGADVLGQILTGKVQVFKSGLSAVETLVGWTILGLGRKKEVFSLVSMALKNFELRNIWELEVLGITDPTDVQEKRMLEEDTLIHFQETLKVNDDKRYEVTLPWLVGHPPLYSNRDVAVTRLRSVTKRLMQEGTFDAYNEVFSNWQKEGIIEEAQLSEVNNSLYYLPHRPVIKLTSATTKIRPVFDGSFKTKGSASLNDCLSTGPSLTQQIYPLLNRFRWGTIGATADIKQAFLQISVNPIDRDVLRFLWYKDSDCSTIVEYRHCRVVFGITTSPFLLNATILHHLGKEKFKSEDIAFTRSKLENGFYVDNLVTSVEDEDQFQILKSQAIEIMADGCFDLRCWFSTGCSENPIQSVLGLKWNCETDEMSCIPPKPNVDLSASPSKRILLSIVNSVYDPIGFSCPAMLVPKLILQEAWRRKLSWDEELPEDLKERFHNWAKHLGLIERCSIPRRMFRGKIDDATLHIFSDASGFAYACCAFLRCEDQGQVFVNLVAAKSRVMPMSRPTIPRAELLGAAIAARLYKSILESLKLPIKTFFWSDSMVALAWIKKQEPWNTFVGNRVKEIRELTDINAWRHIPGELNPADLPSRSCNWYDLLCQKWWEGPLWLQEGEGSWPVTNLSCPEEALKECRKIVSSATNVYKEVASQRFLYFSKYSMIVRMLRFSTNSLKARVKVEGAVSSEEFQRAELGLIKMIQSEWPDEIRKNETSMKFYESEGILKVRTRLELGEDDENLICPIVLPDHIITRRLIEYTHKILKHAGVQTILGYLREKYWIPRGRKIIREVVSKCIPCKRHSTKHSTTECVPLPSDRIQRVAAFQVAGADLAGPVFLRGGIKAWIVLFTCAVYRAVHLELVTSLSTDTFIQALRRFIARRGRCWVIYTDQGTNFLGTARALQNLDWKAIQADCAAQQIKWNFNPPSAPWYGGWWERLIGVLKDLLKKNLGKASLSYEEMLTVLTDCESTINQRPLTYTSEDPNEPKPLTPAHFLREVASPLHCDTIDLDQIDRNHLRKRICYLQRVRENFRKRFQREYLAALVKNPEDKQRYKLKKGDIVLVGSDNSKRIEWPLARVEELISGKDGKQRVARLKLAHTTLIRPVQRLYPLEIRSEDLPSICNITKPRNSDITVDTIVENPEIKRTRSGRQVKMPQRLVL